MRTALGINELRINANSRAHRLNAALKSISDAELAADLTDVERLIFVSPGGTARDYEDTRKARKVRRQCLGDAINQSLVRHAAADVEERQNDQR